MSAGRGGRVAMTSARRARQLLAVVLVITLAGVAAQPPPPTPTPPQSPQPPQPPRPPPPGWGGALRAPNTTDNQLIIGGLGINGQTTFLTQFVPIFSTYLNAVLGATLNKTFQAVYLDFTTTYTAVPYGQIDFIYTNPSIFACLEVTIQSLRASATPPYLKTPQSQFGANLFTLANRTDINLIADIAGKRLEGADLTGLGAGQREMFERNLSFWNLPSSVVFSHNQNLVAQDVATGYADVGMVRTDLLESLQSPTCKVSASVPACFPPGTFKILEPRTYPGFQFNTTTVLYPEWPVAALPHVDFATRTAVTEALLNLNYKADPNNYTVAAAISTFTPPLSYDGLRDMQRELNWIVGGQCITSTQTYQTIVCDPGTYKLPAATVAANCAAQGVAIACKPGYDCTCAPCAPVPPVQLTVSLAAAGNASSASAPCAKMQQCGSFVEGTPLVATLTDNWAGAVRAALGAANVTGVQFKWYGTPAGASAAWVAGVPAPGGGAWSVTLPTPQPGLTLLEVAANGAPLDQSPLVVNVQVRLCAGANTVPGPGGCSCVGAYVLASNGVDCVLPAAPGVNVGAAVGGSVGGGAALLAVVALMLVAAKRRAERAWRIPLSQIHFSDPPEILGRGTFGLVVKGEYRGTTVALKRMLPQRKVAGASKGGGATSLFDLVIPAAPDPTASTAGFASASASGMWSGGSAPVVPSTRRVRASTGGGQEMEVIVAGGVQHASRSSESGAAPGSGNTSAGSGSWGDSFLGTLLGAAHARRNAAKLRADFVREMRLVVHLRHPNITTVLGAVLDRGGEPILCMEMMARGSLYDLLHNDTVPLDAELIVPIVSDVCSGLAFLHAASPPICHNDVKAANVLVDASFRAKVSDFGLSSKSRAVGGQPGTPLWMAPELLRRVATTSTATDVYAFGVTLAEVFSRADPYAGSGLDAATVLAEVAAGPDPEAGRPEPRRPHVGAAVPPLFADIMRRCWAESPAARPSMAAITEEIRAGVAGADATASVTAALMAAKHSLKSDRALLHQVFPPAVAEALAAGRRVEPQQYDSVTIFFSDIAGFTDISAAMSATKVMDMLDRLYREFDRLTTEHGLYKVETIGDAYMVCGALRDGQAADHCARVAAFAWDAVAAAAGVAVDPEDPGKGTVNIRAGFHSGPVIASVVGHVTPRYCLFGDTVNTASRMESNSAKGRVNMSEDAAALLRQQAPGVKLEDRGLVPIKGKGDMHLFWLAAGLPREQQPWRVEAPAAPMPSRKSSVPSRQSSTVPPRQSSTAV